MALVAGCCEVVGCWGAEETLVLTRRNAFLFLRRESWGWERVLFLAWWKLRRGWGQRRLSYL